MGGGASRVAWETARRLVADYETHILACGNVETSTRDGVTIHSVPPKYPATLLYSTLLKSGLTRSLKDIAPNIVHSHIALPWGYIFAKAKCARVITCHGLGWLGLGWFGLDLKGGLKSPKRNYLVRPFLKTAISNADVVCVPSKRLAELIEDSYGVDCTILPNGVDTHVFAPLEAKKRRSNVVLYVGRFTLSKGLADLLAAAKALPEYEFWLAGYGTGLAASSSLPNVRLLGHVRNVNTLASFYNQATLCAFPSYWESFSLVCTPYPLQATLR